jgi:hypothetical protein
MMCMGLLQMGICRACGARIEWMRTERGRMMPCERELVWYWQDEQGPERIINHAGEVVRCRLKGDRETATGLGRVPHWTKCGNPGALRRRPRPKKWKADKQKEVV